MKSPSAICSNLFARRGIASLPVILLVGGIIVEVGITGVLLFYFLNTNLSDARLSNSALIAAQTGIEDALLKITRNKNCPELACPSPYSITAGDQRATVTICKDTCAGVGKTQVTSVGESRNKQHTLRAILTVSALTGEVSIDSITELIQ